MREIKFRYAWKRKEDGHIWTEIVPIECLETRGDTPYVHHSYCYDIWELISRDQFTGLLDRNGVEIYEGDIIRYGYKDKLFPVEFKFGGWFIDWDGGYYIGNEINPSKEAEVIGNIYQNPELIKESK